MKRSTLIALILAAGCTAKSPDDFTGSNLPDMGGPQIDMTQPPLAPVVRISGTAATTDSMTVSVHGTGPSNGTVLIETEAGTASAIIGGGGGNGGSFCVDAPLVANKVNHLKARAVTQDGVYSEIVTFDVVQTGTSGNTGGNQQLPRDTYNAAINAAVTIEAESYWQWLTYLSGSAADIVDVATNQTTARLRYEEGGYDTTYIWLGLVTPNERINRIHIVSGPMCPLQDYDVYVSKKPSPGEPSATNADWTKIPFNSQRLGDDDISLAQTLEVTHIALVLHKGEVPTGCEGGFWDGYPNYYDIKSVEALTEAFSPPPAPPANDCKSGG